MRAFVVTPPAPVVTWADADSHLKLDGDTSQQIEVEAMIAAATATLDGPGGWLGRALGPQTIEARFDNYCAPYRLDLPYRPIIDIVSVSYLDATRTVQTVDPSLYELIGASLETISTPAWTGGLAQREAIRVRYRAGYVVDPLADPLVAALPANIRAAILLMVGDLYRFRETSTIGMTAAKVPMSTTVENLLGPSRVYC